MFIESKVNVVTVSGAPETAPIEPRFCRAILTIALCGMASTVSWIAPHHTALGPLTCRLNASIASIKAWHLSLKGPRTFYSLFPSPVCIAQCTALLPRCRVTWRFSLFQYGAVHSPRGGRQAIWTIEPLRPCYCHFIGKWAIHFTLDAVLLLIIAVMGLFTRLPADQRLFELLLDMLSYLGFPLRTSGSLVALLVVSHLKISWLLLHPDFQDSIWERQLAGYLLLSLIVNWLCLSLSTAVFQPHQNWFIYVSSPFLPANSKITAFFSFQCVWHTRLGAATPRCNWHRISASRCHK